MYIMSPNSGINNPDGSLTSNPDCRCDPWYIWDSNQCFKYYPMMAF